MSSLRSCEIYISYSAFVILKVPLHTVWTIMVCCDRDSNTHPYAKGKWLNLLCHRSGLILEIILLWKTFLLILCFGSQYKKQKQIYIDCFYLIDKGMVNGCKIKVERRLKDGKKLITLDQLPYSGCVYFCNRHL